MLAHLYLRPDGGRIKAVGALDARVVLPDGRSVPITPDGLDQLLEDADARKTFVACTTSFAAFVDVWQFKSLETGEVLCMGEHLWPSQETYIRVVSEHKHVMALKARKLSITTTECAYSGWVARFGTAGRVHLFSRFEGAARDLLRQIHFGLDHLPEYMRLPTDPGASIVRLLPGTDDERVLQAYPASRQVAREATAQHTMCDEIAFMPDPALSFQAIEPTIAPGGSSHIITTGNGPVGFCADLWRKCEDGSADRYALFIDALQRPSRTPETMAALAKTMDRLHFQREYPMTADDALAGGGELVFTATDIDAATDPRWARGFQPYVQGRRYAVGVDLGWKDATVVTVLDCTDEEFDVVGWRYMRNVDTSMIQAAVEDVARAWPSSFLLIEDNSLGRAIRDNLSIPGADRRVQGFTTTAQSKARILGALVHGIEQGKVHWLTQECPNLTREMSAYAWEDKNLRQDAVISIALAVEAAKVMHEHAGGRVLGVYRV